MAAPAAAAPGREAPAPTAAAGEAPAAAEAEEEQEAPEDGGCGDLGSSSTGELADAEDDAEDNAEGQAAGASLSRKACKRRERARQKAARREAKQQHKGRRKRRRLFDAAEEGRRRGAAAAAQGDVEELRRLRSEKRVAELADFKNRSATGTTVVLDLEWEDEMTERELKSLVQQVMYCYGTNRSAPRPVQLVLSGLRVKSRTAQMLRKISGFDAWPIEALEGPYVDRFPRERLVYLTADAEEVLHDFDPQKVYVIGGIVDHNRLKGSTLRKAEGQDIGAAQLPLAEHIEMGSFSRVLAVNHVFASVVEHQACRDWRQVFERCVPGRKRFVEPPPSAPSAGAAAGATAGVTAASAAAPARGAQASAVAAAPAISAAAAGARAGWAGEAGESGAEAVAGAA